MQPSPNFCGDCKQDLIRDCAETTRPTRPCLVRTIRRLEAAANYVGISTPALVKMLRAGMTLNEVLDIIQTRLEAKVRASRLVA